MLNIKNLRVRTRKEKKNILKGVDFSVKNGEIHAIMGKNGSGKSTLCKVIMGHPKYEVIDGSITFKGKDVLKMKPDERGRLGIFLGFQNPPEIQGVALGSFLRTAKNAQAKEKISPIDFLNDVKAVAERLKIKPEFIESSVNDGSSGGEKKRVEALQMSLLNPKLVLMDEIDSGLDIDALKTVSKEINGVFKKSSPAVVLVTHYQRILNYITPHFVHIMADGRIVKSGGAEIAKKLEEEGYNAFID